jgi:hypothetical protein
MSVRSKILLARMALLSFLAEGPFVPLLVGLYPGYGEAIVLAGALVVAVPPGIVIARGVLAGSEDELAERYRALERHYLLAAAASQIGVMMTSLGRGAVGATGLVVSAGGMLSGLWLLRKASAGNRPGARFPT